jgi:predicted secreted protein
MSLTSGIVFYCVIWALTFLMINPLWQTSQGEAGTVVRGTPDSAPVDAMVLRKALWATVWATVAFGILFTVITLKLVTLDDLAWIKPPSER